MYIIDEFKIIVSSILILQAPKKKEKDLDNLKQELDIDDHKIPLEELFRRLHSNPDTVRIICILKKILYNNSMIE
jgi:hypothetical protein